MKYAGNSALVARHGIELAKRARCGNTYEFHWVCRGFDDDILAVGAVSPVYAFLSVISFVAHGDVGPQGSYDEVTRALWLGHSPMWEIAS